MAPTKAEEDSFEKRRHPSDVDRQPRIRDPVLELEAKSALLTRLEKQLSELERASKMKQTPASETPASEGTSSSATSPETSNSRGLDTEEGQAPNDAQDSNEFLDDLEEETDEKSAEMRVKITLLENENVQLVQKIDILEKECSRTLSSKLLEGLRASRKSRQKDEEIELLISRLEQASRANEDFREHLQTVMRKTTDLRSRISALEKENASLSQKVKSLTMDKEISRKLFNSVLEAEESTSKALRGKLEVERSVSEHLCLELITEKKNNDRLRADLKKASEEKGAAQSNSVEVGWKKTLQLRWAQAGETSRPGLDQTEDKDEQDPPKEKRPRLCSRESDTPISTETDPPTSTEDLPSSTQDLDNVVLHTSVV